MPPPFSRWSVRRLMLVIALVAVLVRAMIWAELMERRSAYYQSTAIHHAALARWCDRVARDSGRPRTRAERLAGYHDALRRKYEHASAHPWSSVEPDPPEPE